MKKLAGIALAGLGLVALSSTAQAQNWPTQPITMVVPFAAGSGTDNVARVVAARLGERLGQQVIIENKPGANAQIGAVWVAHAKPDGYTLFMTTNTSHSANPAMYNSLKYDPVKDFTPITRVGELPFALVVKNDLPVKTLPELIAYAKAHPGKLSYGTPNSTSLVASETLRRMAGIDIVGVPYKSSPQVLTDMIGGIIDLYVVDLGSGLGQLRAGKVRPIALTSTTPSRALPNLPTVAATLPGFDLTSWNGILGPAGLPRPVVDKLNTEILAVLANKEVQEQLAQTGFEVLPSASPEAFGQYLKDQIALWGRLVKQAGIQPE
jgi:tripartite-type tricarboxylate transporter receptor subunit TctC